MSAIEVISLIAMILVAGGVSSRVVLLITKAKLGSRYKWGISVVLSGSVGLATAWLAGDVFGLLDSWGSLTAVDVFAFMAAVYTTANGFYSLYFKPKAQAAAASDSAALEA